MAGPVELKNPLDPMSRRARELRASHSLKTTLAPLVGFGLALWLLQWWLAPDWIVSSSSEVDTLVTALPATALALLAVFIAGLLVAVQVVAGKSGSTGVWIILRDMRTWGWVYLVTGIALVTLLLGALAPDGSDPPDSLTSALAAIVIVFALLLLLSGRVIRLRLVEYTDPVIICELAAVSGHAALERQSWPAFERHLEEIGQLASHTVRDQDPRALAYVLAALEGLMAAYLEIAAPVDEGVGNRVTASLVWAGVDSIARDPVTDNSQEIANSMYRIAVCALERSRGEVTIELIRGLGRLGTRTWDFATTGLWIAGEERNLLTPMAGLADLARRAAPSSEEAAAAIECWTLEVAYLHREVEVRGSKVREREWARSIVADSLAELGSGIEWTPALDALRSRSYVWAIQWRQDATRILEELVDAGRLEDPSAAEEVIERIVVA